jgi:hypothetical protein
MSVCSFLQTATAKRLMLFIPKFCIDF